MRTQINKKTAVIQSCKIDFDFKSSSVSPNPSYITPCGVTSFFLEKGNHLYKLYELNTILVLNLEHSIIKKSKNKGEKAPTKSVIFTLYQLNLLNLLLPPINFVYIKKEQAKTIILIF